MQDNLVLSVPGIHLPSLGAELVVFTPILLHADTVKMAHTVLIVCREQIHTFVDVIVNMKRVDCKDSPFDGISLMRQIRREAIESVDTVRTGRVVADNEFDVVHRARIQRPSQRKIGISEPFI